MSQAIATQESVTAAVAALKATGVKVTALSVREYLGGGAQLTITRHLRELRASVDPAATSAPYPEDFLRAIDAAKAPIWEAARNEAKRSFEEERIVFVRNTKADQEELLDSAARIDSLEAENAELIAKVSRLGNEKNDLLLRLANIEDDFGRTKSLETELRQRAETADASAHARAEVIALLRELGLPAIQAPEPQGFSTIDEYVEPKTATLDRGTEPSVEPNSYLVATGRA
ncbi:DNA-binding protein [Aureimonas glaciei]|uniref:KfrA N-terminal DNA-binding domain-containing protein n=1 Tax=Aureimonas glaciei TaxID=1776957 RepID=A0A916YG30_9HYPH|nr:DNA-binding protein [Aureimonas glaciei]GGD43799.1 hypothetical protein GCM10011335_53030 [Aureimonas glaciei]